MGKREEMFETLNSIAKEYNITFNCLLGHHPHSVNLCVEYYSKEGYVLFAYQRDIEVYHYSTTNFEDFKFTVFKNLCSQMGYEYELLNRTKMKKRITHDNDTLKVAYEHTLYLLNSINPLWMEKAVPEYEKLINLSFDKSILKFKEI